MGKAVVNGERGPVPYVTKDIDHLVLVDGEIEQPVGLVEKIIDVFKLIVPVYIGEQGLSGLGYLKPVLFRCFTVFIPLVSYHRAVIIRVGVGVKDSLARRWIFVYRML